MSCAIFCSKYSGEYFVDTCSCLVMFNTSVATALFFVCIILYSKTEFERKQPSERTDEPKPLSDDFPSCDTALH